MIFFSTAYCKFCEGLHYSSCPPSYTAIPSTGKKWPYKRDDISFKGTIY
jgi:hypothetical protein